MANPMTRPDPMTRSGAAWCEQHARWECSARSQRTHSRCHASAIRGTARCRNHAGTSTAVARAKGEALTAWSALAAIDGQPVELVDPAAAVMGMLHMSWLRVHLLAGLLEQQVARHGGHAGEQRAGATNSGTPASGDARDAMAAPGASGGLVGHTFGAVKDVGVYASGEAIRGLAQVEAQERDRCVRYAKAAHDMGIADREIELAERQARAVAVAFAAALDVLAVEAGRREEVQRVFMDRLREQVQEIER